MKKATLLIGIQCLLLMGQAQTRVIIPLLTGPLMPEHGFLPGKKFEFYPTLNTYDFKGIKIRVELVDHRDSLRLSSIGCSTVELNNQSEFAGQSGATAVYEYFQRLFPAAGILLDSAATDTLRVELQALDSRLIGFGSITAHGLCQLRISYRGITRDYCRDLTDKDPHSPISRHAFVTRRTGTRVITSGAIREVLELLLQEMQKGVFFSVY